MVRKRSRVRCKSGPKKLGVRGPTFRALKFELPPKGARLVSHDYLRRNGAVASSPRDPDACMTRWIYKKGDKFYTIIVDGIVLGRFSASDWREGRAIRVVK